MLIPMWDEIIPIGIMMKTRMVAVVVMMAAAKVDAYFIVTVTEVESDSVPVIMVIVRIVMVTVVMISATKVDAELCVGPCGGPQE
jgi:hypothetical protein